MTTCLEVMPKDPHFSSISARTKTSRVFPSGKEILQSKATDMDMMQDPPTANRRSRPLRRLSSVFRRNERIGSSPTSMLDHGDSILDDEEHDRVSAHSSGDSQQVEPPVATISQTNSRPQERTRGRRNSYTSSRKLSSMMSSLKRTSLDDRTSSKAPSSPVKQKRFPLRRDSLEMVRRQASMSQVQYRPRDLHPALEKDYEEVTAIMYPIEPDDTNTSSYNNDHALAGLAEDKTDDDHALAGLAEVQIPSAVTTKRIAKVKSCDATTKLPTTVITKTDHQIPTTIITNAKPCDATTKKTAIPKDLLQNEAVGYARSA